MRTSLDKPLIVAASANEAMAKLAKPGLSATFDVLPLISRWSVAFQAGNEPGESVYQQRKFGNGHYVRWPLLASPGHP
jgi:hypothetical protein